MGSPDLTGRHVNRHAGVPSLVKVAPHDGHPPAPAASSVLGDDDAGLALADDAEHLVPEPAAAAVETSATSGDADVLAGEAAEDGVVAPDADVVNIGNESCSGRVAREEPLAVGVDLGDDGDAVDETGVDGSASEDAAAGKQLDGFTHASPASEPPPRDAAARASS